MKKLHLPLLCLLLVLALFGFFAGAPAPQPQQVGQDGSTAGNELVVATLPEETSQERRSHDTQNQTPSSQANAMAQPARAKERIARSATGESVIRTDDGVEYPLQQYKTLLTPNDPNGNQWWVGGTGLHTAWDRGVGAYQTIVAVIDTGFALGHEEFAGRWQTNGGEQGVATSEASSQLNCSDRGLPLDASCNNIDEDLDGIIDNETGGVDRENPSRLNCTAQGLPLQKDCNNIDDDGNTLIDDVRGWDFSNHDNVVQAGETNPGGPGTTHGTMVSGVLAASGNNGRGIAGVNWHTKILPLQALDDDEYGNTLTVARAVRYAADQKADVISISLGATQPDQYLRAALAYAIEAGSLVVAASGNEGCNCISYPANYPEVLAVGSSNSQGAASSFSNYGSNLDLLAPGENITTPTWTGTNQTNSYASGVAGTSFSTPYVAGLLALARSHQPNASWGELTAALTEETNHASLTATAPHSIHLGFGYARADNLLRRVTSPLVSTIRYQFGPVPASDTLESSRIYQCENGRIPTTPVYELTRGPDIRFTMSELTRQKAAGSGWSSKRIFYSCVGLPHDTISNLRTINLLREIYNRYDKYS